MKISAVWKWRNHNGTINTEERNAEIRESLRRFGWDEHRPLIIAKKGTGEYGVADGNHRLAIARELFGEDHEIPVALEYYKKPLGS